MSDVLTIRKVLREALKKAVHLCSLSPAQIADELTKRGRPTTEAMIYAWMAETKQNWLPGDTIPDLCEILGDRAMRLLFLNDKEKESLELGESLSRLLTIAETRVAEIAERLKESNRPTKSQQRRGTKP